MRLSPKSIYEDTKKRLKGKSTADIYHLTTGTGAVHSAVRAYREGKKQEDAAELAETEASEKEAIKTEKLETAGKKLEAQRKKRRGRASRKGRRASIMSGALGAAGEPTVRRAGVLGAEG